MPEFRRLLYGWYDAGHDCLRISSEPPDAPVRRSYEFTLDVSANDAFNNAKAFCDRKRARIHWWPALPETFLKPVS